MTSRKPTTWPNDPWKAKDITVRLFCDRYGQWWEVIADGNPLPATDVSVAIWKELQAAKKEIERLKGTNE